MKYTVIRDLTQGDIASVIQAAKAHLNLGWDGTQSALFDLPEGGQLELTLHGLTLSWFHPAAAYTDFLDALPKPKLMEGAFFRGFNFISSMTNQHLTDSDMHAAYWKVAEGGEWWCSDMDPFMAGIIARTATAFHGWKPVGFERLSGAGFYSLVSKMAQYANPYTDMKTLPDLEAAILAEAAEYGKFSPVKVTALDVATAFIAEFKRG